MVHDNSLVMLYKRVVCIIPLSVYYMNNQKINYSRINHSKLITCGRYCCTQIMYSLIIVLQMEKSIDLLVECTFKPGNFDNHRDFETNRLVTVYLLNNVDV